MALTPRLIVRFPAPALRSASTVPIEINANTLDPVRFVATSGTLATDFNSGDVYDGLTLAAGDTFLYQPLSGSTTSVAGTTVGIYVVGAGAPVRRTDADTGDEIFEALVVATAGSRAGQQWINVNSAAPVVGTDPIIFRLLSSAGGTPIATQAQAEAKTDNVAYMSSLRVAQQIATGVPGYPTRAAAAADKILGDTFRTADDTLIGGDAGALYVFNASPPANADVITDSTTPTPRKFYNPSRTIMLDTQGKTVHTEILRALNDLKGKGGGCMRVRGTHQLTSTVNIMDFGNVKIEIEGRGHSGATFKAAAGFTASTSILDLRPQSTFTAPSGTLALADVEFDTTALPGPASLVSGLTAWNWRNLLLYNVGGPGGLSLADGRGDTCVGAGSIWNCEWHGGNPRYWSDLAFYPGGANTPDDLFPGAGRPATDDGFRALMKGVLIEYCVNAASLKREGWSLSIEDCDVRGGGGFGTAAAGTAPDSAYAGKFLSLKNTRMYYQQGSPVFCQGGDSKLHMSGCWIRDWGRNANGTPSGFASTVWAAVRLMGCSDAQIANNVFEMRDFPPGGGAADAGSHVGVRHEPVTFFGGTAMERTYKATNNIGRCNTYINLDHGIWDHPEGANYYSEELIDQSVVNPVRPVSFNPSSHFSYFRDATWLLPYDNQTANFQVGDTISQLTLLLSFDAQSANFSVGELVTGGTSGAAGVVVSQQDAGGTGDLVLRNWAGTFADNEAITGNLGGAAVVNGTGVVSYDARAIILADTDAGTTGVLTLRRAVGTFADNRTITGSLGGSALVNGSMSTIGPARYTNINGEIRRIQPTTTRTHTGVVDFTYVLGVEETRVVLSGTLAANRTITIDKTTAGVNGDRVTFVRTGGGAFTWAIAGTSATLAQNQSLSFELIGTALVRISGDVS